ncbi:MAG: S-layer homology domain-containing protein [Clostridia bacterium]|nr:S-layer homology domain-containing protein [Clostridia bacterium]
MKTSKLLSLFLAIAMLMTVCAVSVSASGNLAVSWGQDFNDEEYSTPLPGTAMFYHEGGITNYEFKLYKDGNEVYTNRIEEGLFDDEEGFWEEETLFLDKFSEFGTGTYKFSVSSLTGSGNTIDEAEIIQTATSGNFSYRQPTQKLSVPAMQSIKEGKITWMPGDENTYAYLYDLDIVYDNGNHHDPNYTEWFTVSEGVNEFSANEIESVVNYLNNYNPTKYPKSQASVKIRVRALPEDIRSFKPSDYSEWCTIEKPFASGDEEKPAVDRSTVSGEFYDAAKVVYDLGIMSNVYQNPSKAVTRGELAVTLVALMGLEDSADAAKDYTRYSDLTVGEYLAGCAEILAYEGIMSGYEDWTFGPDDETTYAQIIKMLVSMCGFDPAAKNYGGYPTGYLYCANRYGISKGLSVNNEATITYEQLAQLVFNTLTCKQMEVDSWSVNGNTYKITDNCFLYDLGYEKYIGDVEVVTDSSAKITGKMYNKSNLDGVDVTEKVLTIEDKDLLGYTVKNMNLYVKDGSIISSIENYTVSVVVNNGETETKTRVVPFEITTNGYTKYKIGDGEYKDIEQGIMYHLIGSESRSHNLALTFTNDKETKVTKLNKSVSFDNKRTITYVSDGRVETKEYSVGYEVSSLPYANYRTGYKTNGWNNVPYIMPDKDITVYADYVKQTSVTGKITFKGEPLSGAYIYRDGYYCARTAEDGSYTISNCPMSGELAITVAHPTENISETFTEIIDSENKDVGEFMLCSATVKYDTAADGLILSGGLQRQFTEEEFAYTEKDVKNTIRYLLTNTSQTYNSNITSCRAKDYPDYYVVSMNKLELYKTKQGTEVSQETLTETSDLFEVTFGIPARYRGRADYLILRDTNGTVDVLTKTPNADGECISRIEDDRISINIKKLSTYAIIGTGEAVKDTEYIANVSWTELDKVDVNVIFPKTENEAASLYVAYYDENGKLLKVHKKDTVEETNTFPSDLKTNKIKVFVWDGKLTPLN